MIHTTRLTNLQLELLKLFSRETSTYELLEIKRLLAGYFSTKLTTEVDKVWSEKGLNNDDMDRWLKELS